MFDKPIKFPTGGASGSNQTTPDGCPVQGDKYDDPPPQIPDPLPNPDQPAPGIAAGAVWYKNPIPYIAAVVVFGIAFFIFKTVQK